MSPQKKTKSNDPLISWKHNEIDLDRIPNSIVSFFHPININGIDFENIYFDSNILTTTMHFDDVHPVNGKYGQFYL
jgi:hypothetical protein